MSSWLRTDSTGSNYQVDSQWGRCLIAPSLQVVRWAIHLFVDLIYLGIANKWLTTRTFLLQNSLSSLSKWPEHNFLMHSISITEMTDHWCASGGKFKVSQDLFFTWQIFKIDNIQLMTAEEGDIKIIYWESSVTLGVLSCQITPNVFGKITNYIIISFCESQSLECLSTSLSID